MLQVSNAVGGGRLKTKQNKKQTVKIMEYSKFDDEPL
jgi:hypothetical protein